MADGLMTAGSGPDAHFLPAYRAIILTDDGRVISTERLTAVDDAMALRLAEGAAAGRPVEVWDGLRFIEHIDAKTA